ncbi:glycosyltransferase [Plastorhodobacter daqingensis]|uniref:Glycosyltransferase n=1 Tax=Plastorhodobacter daqingensis TaxID=1387281 RepID=A0ABW2UNH6_9RHOB
MSGRVTVVVPVHGHPALLDDALGSVYREMESGVITRVIVVEDGCRFVETRRSLAAWQAILGDRLLVLHIANSGLSAARNRGIAAALRIDPELEAVFLLDADNLLAEGGAAVFRQMLESQPDSDWFYPEFDFFGQDGHYITERSPDLLFHAHINICEAGSLIRRRVFEAGVRFDETMRRGYEDWDFWLQAAQQGFRGAPAGQPMLLYRKRPVSMLSNSHDQDTSLRKYLEDKHRWLFSTPALLAREAELYPRYAILEGQGGALRLCTDPDRPRAITADGYEEMVYAHAADPFSHHAPAYLICLRDGVSDRLETQGLLRNVLWQFERRLTRAEGGPGFDLLFLDPGEDGLRITRDAGAPDRPADGVAISLAALESIMQSADHDWIRQIDFVPNPYGPSSWSLALEGMAPLDPTSAGATEILRNLLMQLARSRFRPACEQSWTWREIGGAAPRDMAVEIPRKSTGGGVVFPLLKAEGRRDIAFVVPIFDFGGVEKVAASLAREFAADGDRCHLIVASDRPIRRDGWTLDGFETVNWFPDPSAIDWTGPEYLGTAEPSWGNWHERADLIGLLAAMDVVINAHSGAFHKVADRLRRSGVVTIDHEHLVERSTYGRGYGPPLLALAYEYAYDLFLTCSQSLRIWLHANGIPAEKLLPVVNAPGYPLSAERQAEVLAARAARDPEAPLRLLFLGRLDPQKGVERLRAVFEALHLQDPGIRFTVAGQSIIGQPQAALSFPPGTRMPGPVRGAEALTALLAETDILVLPSYYEGLPLSVLEAQRCGVVVVATDAGAMEEAIEDGVTGFIVPQEGCVEAMVARIQALNTDRATLRTVSEAAARETRTWAQAMEPLRYWFELRAREPEG